jgi:OTU domain-containing protein 6
VNPDGHCLFSAVADQLQLLSILPVTQNGYAVTRAAAAEYMFAHPDDFLPFLPASDDMSTTGIMTQEQFETYCSTVRDTAYWGGEPEILALCCAFGVAIHVIQGGRPPVVVHEPANRSSSPHKYVIRISYHRRMYGLGEVSDVLLFKEPSR